MLYLSVRERLCLNREKINFSERGLQGAGLFVPQGVDRLETGSLARRIIPEENPDRTRKNEGNRDRKYREQEGPSNGDGDDEIYHKPEGDAAMPPAALRVTASMRNCTECLSFARR